MIEAEVFGDPEGMRALASEIAGRADVIGAIPAGFSSALGGAAFEGPAADRLRGAGDNARGGVSSAVAELRGIASALRGDADVVEQMNEDAKAKAAAADKGDGGKRGAGKDGAGETGVPQGGAATPPAGVEPLA